MSEIQSSNSISLKLLNINPEPIGLFTLPRNKHLQYKKELELINTSADMNLRQKFNSEPYTDHICNTTDQNIFKSFPQLKELKIDIKKILLSYIQTIGFSTKEIIINSAWLNNAEKNAVLAYHQHANSYVSANYFVNFTPEEHTPLAFLNDRAGRTSSTRQSITIPPIENKQTIYTASTLAIPAKEGQILVWRSHQLHGYETPNKSDNRITLSLNALPKVLSSERYSFTINE